MCWHLANDEDVKNTDQGETKRWNSQPTNKNYTIKRYWWRYPVSARFRITSQNLATYASSTQAFSLNYGPPQVVKTPGLVIHEPKTGVDLVDPLAVPDFDELAEKGKSLQDKALEKYELLEKKDENNGRY